MKFRTLLTSVTALALATTMANAQFRDWDEDDDERIAEEEFNAGWGEESEEAFGEWDADGDGLLNEEEFGAAAFGAYDEDEDGAWNEEEAAEFEDDGWF